MRKMLGMIVMGLAMSGSACTSKNVTDETPTSEYRPLGRHVLTDAGHLQFAWPASGVEVRFEGASLKVDLEDTGSNIVDITIDGKTEMLHLRKGVHEYVLLDEDAPKEHIVTITRRSEVFDFGMTSLVSVHTDGTFLNASERARKIMVLGDSISVGFGAEGADQDCEYTPETGAPLRTYAKLSADAFNADIHVNAVSGRGVVRNYDDSEEPLMPYLYNKALPDHGPDWDHSVYQPDVILINLGTNDYSQGDPGERFYDAYVKLLSDMRTHHPKAQIYAAYSPMGIMDGERPVSAVNYTQRALETRRKAGDDKVGYIYLPQAESGHVYGCSFHPGLDSHKAMADVFIARIGEDMGWMSNP